MLNLLEYFRTSSRRRNTAALAKERLQIIVAHERGNTLRSPDYLPLLQKELLEVVRKYVSIDEEQVKISMDKEGDCEILELNITLPETHVPKSNR